MEINWPDELIFMKNKNLPQKKCNDSMQSKTCVITGATSGVGLEALKKLAQSGANVVIVARNSEKANQIKDEIVKLYNVTIDVIIADFSKLSDVRNAASTILSTYPRIDVLINSAGLHSTKRIETVEGFELVFCVNHLAAFLFTSLLLERMEESAPSRIIMVNSEGHRFNGFDINDLDWKKRHYTGLRGYGASKTAQLLTVWEFADLLKGTGVTINAMHPGDVKTNIGNNNGLLYKWFLHNVTWHALKDPEISGDALKYLAASPELENVSGLFFNLTIEEKPAKHALDREVGKLTFDLSKKLTGLS